MKLLCALIPAVVIAPWIVVPLVIVASMWSGDAGPVVNAAWLLVIAVISAVPLAYAGILFVGVPAFLLLRRFGLARSWAIVAVGGLAPVLASVGEQPYFQLLLCACGAAVALTAWQLVPLEHREREHQ